MPLDQKQLFRIARDFPWYLFTGAEISSLCNVGEDQVRRVRRAPDSPFRYGKCRPEWFADWMQKHPEGKVLPQSPPASLEHFGEWCARFVAAHLHEYDKTMPPPKVRSQRRGRGSISDRKK